MGNSMNAKEIVYYYALQLYMNGVRLDADEGESENLNQPKKGHGGTPGTRLPYGLCQAAGIDVPKGATPRDAWDLLASKGIVPDDVYRTLRTEKSVKSVKEKIKSGTTTFKGKVEKFSDDHMYHGLMKTPMGKKLGRAIQRVYNETESSDPYARELVGRMGELFEQSGENFPVKVGTRSTEAALGSYIRDRFGQRIVEVSFPSLTRDEDARISTAKFTHEMAHAIDHALQDMGEPSWENKKLCDAINQAQKKINSGSIGEPVKKVFADFNSKLQEVSDRQKKEISDKEKELNLKYYGHEGGWSATGKGFFAFPDSAHRERAKELKAFYSKSKIRWDCDRRKANGDDGCSALQGLYDAISSGRLRSSGVVKYGHSERYYDGDRENAPTEVFADFMALAMCYPKEYKLFKDDQPELCAALEEYTKGIVDKWLSEKKS